MHEVTARLAKLLGCKYCADAVKIAFKYGTCHCKYDDCPYANEINAEDTTFCVYEKIIKDHTYPACSKIYTNSGEYAHANITGARRAAFYKNLKTL